MPYNKYNTRNSGRFNKPGNFISTGEVGGASSRSAPTRPGRQLAGSVGGAGQCSNNIVPPRSDLASAAYGAHPHAAQEQYGGANQSKGEAQAQYFGGSQQPPLPPSPSGDNMLEDNDVDMKMGSNAGEDAGGAGEKPRHFWKKNKVVGVKKLSNKERRRRQNETLRRLLTPKNALMVLNEMVPSEQVASQFKVEQTPGVAAGGRGKPRQAFCADLALEGAYFKGYGENKMAARNAAAEQAVRNIILRRMYKALSCDGSVSEGGEGEDEALPMIQLASFALHKLFSEWECEGYRVPALRSHGTEGYDNVSAASFTMMALARSAGPPVGAGVPAGAGAGAGAGAEAGAGAGAGEGARLTPRAPKKPRLLPLNAASMHPCMLLAYMRPSSEYRELAAEGDKPQNMVFTFGVDVDGTTYVGKASKKKEARRAAARAACHELFGVEFDEAPTATTPVVPTLAPAPAPEPDQ